MVKPIQLCRLVTAQLSFSPSHPTDADSCSSSTRFRSRPRRCSVSCPRGPVGTPPQFLPNPPPEGGRLHVGRQIQTRFLPPQVRQNLTHALLQALGRASLS